MVALLHRTCPGQKTVLGTGHWPVLGALGWTLVYARAKSWSLGSGDSCYLLQEVGRGFLNLSHIEMGRAGGGGGEWGRQRPSLQVGRLRSGDCRSEGLVSRKHVLSPDPRKRDL